MKLTFPSEELLEAKGHQDFLRVLYRHNKKNSKDFSFSFLAQRCGFSSKSFLKSVIDKKKRLSLESAYQVTHGLRFPSTWNKYFVELVKQDLHVSSHFTTNTNQQDRLRKKLSSRKSEFSEELGSTLFERIQFWPYVYASLGTSENGASLFEIANRSGLSEAAIEMTLNFLIQQKLVTKKGRRYLPLHSEVFFEKLGHSDFFKNFYRQSLLKSQNLAQRNFGDQDKLFYSVTVSLDPHKMHDFRTELAELLDRFTTEVESPSGSKIAILNCAFHCVGPNLEDKSR